MGCSILSCSRASNNIKLDVQMTIDDSISTSSTRIEDDAIAFGEAMVPRDTVISGKEVETILKLIDDWGFEYNLRCTLKEVGDLRERLLGIR